MKVDFKMPKIDWDIKNEGTFGKFSFYSIKEEDGYQGTPRVYVCVSKRCKDFQNYFSFAGKKCVAVIEVDEKFDWKKPSDVKLAYDFGNNLQPYKLDILNYLNCLTFNERPRFKDILFNFIINNNPVQGTRCFEIAKSIGMKPSGNGRIF